VCALARDIAIVDSFVTDPDDWQEHVDDIPTMEFYELDELGNQFGNWVGPTVGCLQAMCRAAGFARVELLGTGDHHAVVACYRQWEAPPEQPPHEAPEVLTIENARNGINFSTRKSEEYVSCLFRTSRPVTTDILRLEVDDFGAAALFATQENGVWRATFRLPPGLDPGWHTARMRFGDSTFGRESRIAVDLPLKPGEIVVKDVYDGVTWVKGEVKVGERGFLSCWVAGLPENADRANVRAVLEDRRLNVDYVGEPNGEGYRQINVAIPADTGRGAGEFRILCAGVSSNSLTLTVR
jgi:uncharacterized protein (TIGR03437 family)